VRPGVSPITPQAAIIGPMRVSASEALRFLLELGGIVALGYWGIHASRDLPIQAVLAVGAPAALIVVWALFIAPRAVFQLPRLAQAIAGGLLLEIAALALILAGHSIVGLVFGGLVAIDTAALAVAEASR
jgi:fermentation-respiration switch protein FrsA (DUF1100 family)